MFQAISAGFLQGRSERTNGRYKDGYMFRTTTEAAGVIDDLCRVSAIRSSRADEVNGRRYRTTAPSRIAKQQGATKCGVPSNDPGRARESE
jgi:hypothetical protein